ncbi:HAD family hydrolase [Aurantivibrio plasticivorans]
MKAVFFDLDETILDRTRSLRDFVRWQAEGMLKNSIGDVDFFWQRFVELDSNGSVWKDRVYSKLVDEFSITEWTVSELLKTYELCFSNFCKPKSNALQAIRSLHGKGLKLGLVSNGKSPFQERNFDALGVSDLFDAVIVSDAVGCRKPDCAIFELACRSLEVSPEESVFVGDNPKADIDGARSFGMYTVYIPGCFGLTYDNAHANCNNFLELAGIVENVAL